MSTGAGRRGRTRGLSEVCRTGGNSISPARCSINIKPRQTMSRGMPFVCFHCQASHSFADSARRLAPAFSETNRRMKAISSAVITRPRYFHSAAMGRSLTEAKPERKCLAQFFLRTHSAPDRCRCCLRVARRQQQLRLMGLQSSSRLLPTRPPDKPPFRQPLLRQPEPLAVVGENANRRAPPAAEHKQTSREGILLELLLAQPGQ